MNDVSKKFDSLIIGGGIAGLQSAIDLAEQGYKVLVIEKDHSIGGKMIALSKVFPTLDCSSCICSPRMAEASHHDNITMMLHSEVTKTKRIGNRFEVTVLEKATYVDQEKCTGCRLCEYACPVYVKNKYEGNLAGRKVISVPFTNAIPQLAFCELDDCILCGACEKACPTDAINFMQKDQEFNFDIGAIIIASGFELDEKNIKPQFGGGKLKNILEPLQVERIIAPHGPYGRILRPSDGKIPDSVAYIQCSGSRDASDNIGVSYCSRVCCMYAIKQAMLLCGALPLVDVTIYNIDVRAFGKGYEQFYQNAKAMGIEFVKSKVARITEDQDCNPIVRYEVIDQDGQVEERTHDMVVLTPGILPGWNPQNALNVEIDNEDKFVFSPNQNNSPALTTESGIFIAGTATGPKDIPDAIIEAGSAAMAVANYLEPRSNSK